jgi:LuxR family maltose regulon positive regulatory protein
VLQTGRHQRFIIERPRLIELLDSLEARIILLTAPAGYGKSTLARQWAAKRENVLWYEATAASRDVAALAMGLARACQFAPAAETHLRSHLDALASPDAHAYELAQTFSELANQELRARSSTIVVDNADTIHSSACATSFLHAALDSSDVRCVIIGRQRPPWVSTRKLVYAEIAEIDRDTLAFTEAEAAELLSNLPGSNTRALWSRARGWPAVLRLAVLTQSSSIPEEPLQSSLHEYFAEELYSLASERLRARLPQLALFPTLPGPVLHVVLERDQDALIEEAVEIGFLSSSGARQWEMHPLLRTFLLSKLDRQNASDVWRDLLLAIIDLHEWDNAFALIRQLSLLEHLPQLVARSLDALLSEGRLTTLDDWVALGHSEGVDSPDLYLLEAELSRRSGLFVAARSQALKAAEMYRITGHPWASRSFSIAGTCAHLAQYSPDAGQYYESAKATAQTDEDARRALWGQFLTCYTQEDASAESLLNEFSERIGADPAARLQHATGKFILACAQGALEDTIRKDVEPYIDLAKAVRDPLIRSSFYYQLGSGLSMVGRYRAALSVVELGEDEVRLQRLSFARTHFLAARISAMIGTRRFKRAASLLDELTAWATRLDDTFELPNARVLRARLLISIGNWEDAAAEVRDWDSTPVIGLSAELAAVRALALALGRSPQDAEALAQQSLAMSGNAQAQTAARAALAVLDYRGCADPCSTRLRDLEDVVRTRQDFDALVMAYRAHPPLLEAIVANDRIPRQRLLTLVSEARDVSIASSAGLDVSTAATVRASLSPREEEVFELMCHGRTNKEIARLLFISEATVKVHVRHILGKLNARSRTEAVARNQDA